MTRDNRGSTLITVIVAIAFVTILTSIILSTTAMNMSMKGIDRKVKDDFYYAEKGLNDVYTGVGQYAAKRVGKRYDDAFKEIGATYATAVEADAAYRQNFLTDIYTEYSGATLSDRIGKLNPFIVSSLPARLKSVKVTSADAAKYRDKNGNDSSLSDAVAVVIPNVTVTATDKDDFRSVIKSDIVIQCPTVDFLGTNAEITDYSLIACQGVYFTEGAGGSKYIDVNGDLYGGVHPAASTTDEQILNSATYQVYGGINVYNSVVNLKSNQIVSKGDINISGSGSELNIGSNEMVSSVPGVWFDTMRTVKGAASPKVTVRANMYALNDLELNANGSDVRLLGGYDYYGYNDKTLTIDPEASPVPTPVATEHSLSFTSDRKDADSSSIIINGNSCRLDMSDVHTLVLMGKAFVDFSSKGRVLSGDKTVASAEGLALQTNQQLYVVPVDFLTIPNPATDTTYQSGFATNKTRGELDTDYPTVGSSDGWFGYRYVRQTKTTSGNASSTVDDIFDVHKVELNDTHENVYYAYLKFNDDLWIKNESTGKYEDAVTVTGKPRDQLTAGSFGSVSSKTAFFDEIMSSDPNLPDEDGEVQPSASRLKKKILLSIENDDNFNLQGCVVNNTSSAVIYGRNAIVHYSTPDYVANPPSPTPTPTPTVEYKVKANTEGMERFANYPENLLQRYQLLCVFLDSWEGTPLNTHITLDDPDGYKQAKITSDWNRSAVVTSPMDSFVLMSALPNNLDTSSSPNTPYIEGSDAFGSCVAYHKSAPYTISSDFKGVAFVYGDIIVKSGVKVDGLLMATGTITVEGGASDHHTTIKANKGIIQSRIEKEISLIEEGGTYENNYIISYLSDGDIDTPERMYKIVSNSRVEADRIEADYNSFMHYENWSKAE